MQTEVAQFCLDRIEEDLSEFDLSSDSSRKPYAVFDLMSRRQMVEYFDSVEDMNHLGALAAEWAYHPDYKNWSAPDHVAHRNVPATVEIVLGEK